MISYFECISKAFIYLLQLITNCFRVLDILAIFCICKEIVIEVMVLGVTTCLKNMVGGKKDIHSLKYLQSNKSFFSQLKLTENVTNFR